jgi:hypothetical protein
MFSDSMQEVNLKILNFQFILLTFLFRTRCMHRKFQLQDLWSCALAWYCQKYNLTSHKHTRAHAHTHTFSQNFTNNFFLHTTRNSHAKF